MLPFKLVLFLFSILSCAATETVQVSTTFGAVLGSSRSTSSSYFPYISFQGIPYAAPPVGNLRLKAPIPPTPWNEPLDVSGNSTKVCPQLLSGEVIGEEDCLYLNVYTPALHKVGEVMPVLVWIYGGGFITGNAKYSEYGPDKWIDQDIVVVTVNYRGGALGFFSLGVAEVSGNQGLLDQNLALMFVKDNIEQFGGNKDDITLMGQSAGSSSTLYHLMSPRSQGLFNKVIAQSGSNFSPSLHSVTGSQAAHYGNRAADAMGCLLGPVHHKINCLQGLDMEKFAKLSQIFLINLKPNEDADYAEDPFLPMSPMNALRNGSYAKDVKVLVGSNKDDGLILTTILETNPIMYWVYRTFWPLMAPGILFHTPIDQTTQELKDKAVQLAEFYLGGVENMVPENFQLITDMFTDGFVTYAVHCFVDYARNTQDIYHYMYSHMGEYGLNPDNGVEKLGVNHADELYLQWDPLYGSNHALDTSDQAMSNIIIDLWTSFIKSGVPKIDGIEWEKASPTSHRYLVLNDTSYMDYSEQYTERMEFWQSLFPC